MILDDGMDLERYVGFFNRCGNIDRKFGCFDHKCAAGRRIGCDPVHLIGRSLVPLERCCMRDGKSRLDRQAWAAFAADLSAPVFSFVPMQIAQAPCGARASGAIYL